MGLFFFVSVFSSLPALTVCHVCTVCSKQYYPCVRGGREGEYRQAGWQVGKAASRPYGPTLPRWGRRVGMHSQVGGSGCCGPLSGVRTAQCMHMLRGTCPIQYHTTVPRPASIYYSPLYPGSSVCRGQHFSPSGLADDGNDKDKAREAGARRPVLYLGTQVLYCGTVLSPQEVSFRLVCSLCSCTQSVYTAGRAPCIRTWKVLRNNT